MNKEEFELSINMSDEEIERIKNILCASRGVRHYLLKIHNDEELDVVEYKEYQKLEEENKEQEEYITYWQKEMDKRQDKIDKAIELLNQYLKDWDNSFLIKEDLNAIRCVLKDSDVDD